MRSHQFCKETQISPLASVNVNIHNLYIRPGTMATYMTAGSRDNNSKSRCRHALRKCDNGFSCGVKSSSSSRYEIKIIRSSRLFRFYQSILIPVGIPWSGFPPCLLVVGGAALPLAGVVHPRCADRTGDEVGGARGHEVSHCR